MKSTSLVYFFIAIYIAVFLTMSILKHESFNSTGADLGEYGQDIWGLSKGEVIFDTTVGLRVFSAHFDPIQLLIVPFYWIYSDPITLLAIQTIMLSLGALGVYLIAKLKLKNETSSLILSAAYLLNPSVHYINLFDFHPIAFAIPFILFAFYYMEKKDYRKSVIFLILLAMTKEHLPLYLTTFGIYMFIKHKKKKLGSILAITGILWFILGIWVTPYLFSGGAHGFIYFQRYFGQILSKILLLALWFAPVAFTAILSPQILLLGITEFGIILTHSPKPYIFAVYQHQASVIPIIFIAAIYSIPLASKIIKAIAKKAKIKTKGSLLTLTSAIILISTIVSYIAYGPFTVLYDLKEFNINTGYVKTGNKFIAMIPKDASVSANNWVIPHLSQRYKIFKFPKPLYEIYFNLEYSKPDYVLLDMSEALTDPKRAGAGIKDTNFNLMFNDKDYGVIESEGTWILLKKGADYEQGICKIRDFLNKSEYPYLNIILNYNIKYC